MKWSELDARLEAMAERWRYSAFERHQAMAEARAKPKEWLAVIEADERRAEAAKAAGAKYP